MTNTAKIHSATDLASRLLSPAGCEDFSPLCGMRYLLLDIAGLDRGTQDDPEGFLNNFQCPVIGIGPPNSPLAPACDVIVKSRKEAGPLMDNIEAHPLAAATLVQLLRHNERASLRDGLFAESLAYATLQASMEFKTFLKGLKADESVPEFGPAVLIQRQENQLILTLNRPENRNAFSIAMRDELMEGLNLLACDSTLEKATLKGAGKCFSTGGDLSEFGLADDIASAHLIRSTRNVGRSISELADRIQCHLQGACIGSGIELPAFASHITATENTFFQLPELTMGLIPGAGGTVSILKRIGRHHTAYLVLSAKRINSHTALAWGLIDQIN